MGGKEVLYTCRAFAGEWGCPMNGGEERLSATSPTLNILGKWDVDDPPFGIYQVT
jgi:hypothetical protein